LPLLTPAINHMEIEERRPILRRRAAVLCPGALSFTIMVNEQ